MKKALLYFAFFFITLSIGGYIAGSRIRTSPVRIKADLASRIRLVDNGNEAFLVLDSEDKPSFWQYDLATKKVQFADPAVILNAANAKAKEIPDAALLVANFVGGGTSWKLMDIVKALQTNQAPPQDKWAIAASVAGGAIGLGGGYYLGMSRHLPDSSPEVLYVLRDPGEIADLKRLAYLTMYAKRRDAKAHGIPVRVAALQQVGGIKLAVARNSFGPKALAMMQLKEGANKAADPTADMTREDFAMFKLAD